MGDIVAKHLNACLEEYSRMLLVHDCETIIVLTGGNFDVTCCVLWYDVVITAASFLTLLKLNRIKKRLHAEYPHITVVLNLLITPPSCQTTPCKLHECIMTRASLCGVSVTTTPMSA